LFVKIKDAATSPISTTKEIFCNNFDDAAVHLLATVNTEATIEGATSKVTPVIMPNKGESFSVPNF